MNTFEGQESGNSKIPKKKRNNPKKQLNYKKIIKIKKNG